MQSLIIAFLYILRWNLFDKKESRASIKSENKHYIKSTEELEEEEDNLKAENKTATVSLGTSKYGGQCYNFDIGRSRVNEYNIKSVKDTYYQFDNENGKFVGKELPSSSDYGRGVWEYDYKPPKFGGKSEVKKFSDRSHLKVGRKQTKNGQLVELQEKYISGYLCISVLVN